MNEQSLSIAAAGHVPAAVPGSSGAAVRSKKKAPLPRIDYLSPAGAPALYAPDSVAWAVFKNPVALFAGGIAAVLLELGESRVRSGVWGHSIFPTDPVLRMQRTGYVTHVSVYAPVSVAERVIGGVVRMHDKVEGYTPDGVHYRANDPELLNWVQATVGYGFMEAYSAFCRPLSRFDKDRSYLEAVPAANLFLATGAPRSVREQEEQFEAMKPNIEPHPIVFEFLDIMIRTPGVPAPLRPLQSMMVRAGISVLPTWTIERLGLDTPKWRLRAWERRLVKAFGAVAERIPVRNQPPAQASVRLGLPANYLYRR